MGDLVTELEGIYDVLGSSSTTSETRKIYYDAFERLKRSEQSFTAAKEVVRRRKSEGSVYTALLVIDHHICNNWQNISKFENLDNYILEVVKLACELNTNLVISGVSNVAFHAIIRNSTLITHLQSNLINSDLLNVEIFYVILEKILNGILDFNQKMTIINRDSIRMHIKRTCTNIYWRAYEKINLAHVENEPHSSRVISNIFSACAVLISSDATWAKNLFDDISLCSKFITLSYVLLDKCNQKYHVAIASFLKIYSEKAIMRTNFDNSIKSLISDDKFLALTNFIKCTSSYSARYEASLFFSHLVRIVVLRHTELGEIYPRYIFDLIAAFSTYDEPQKKSEYSVSYNSIGDENQLLKDTEVVIYRFCMNVFSVDQRRAALIGIKYGCRLIESCLYEESMSMVDYSGISMALRNISWVTELGNHQCWSEQTQNSSSIKEVLSMSELMLKQLINAPIKSLKHLNCFVDVSQCLVQYFSFVPHLWPDYLKQLHSHTLGLIQASKEDVLNSFCAIVSDAAFNLCLFDWIERDHLDNYITLKAYIDKTEVFSVSSVTFYMNIMRSIMDNQQFMSGLNSIEFFLMYFGLGDDVFRPEVIDTLKQLFQVISITSVYFTELKLLVCYFFLLSSKDNSIKILDTPEFDFFKHALFDIYRFFQRVWRCFCDLWNLQIMCPRSPQLIKAIQQSNRRMIECTYEQRYTSFENIELRLQSFGKNICLDEGNWLIEASNLTDDVNMAVSYFCLRVIDLSSLVNVDILKNITENQPMDSSTLSRFECSIYTNDNAWMSLMKLVFTLIAYGTSKIIIRICEHSYIQNHLKLRLPQFPNDFPSNERLVTHAITCLLTICQSKQISQQATQSALNLFIHIISLYVSILLYVQREICPSLETTLKQLTAFPSSGAFLEKLSQICNPTIPIKNKRQALYTIINHITVIVSCLILFQTDDENVELLIEQ
ncbi:hypothetical protein HZS_1879, partial [Henneguya salminicola]